MLELIPEIDAGTLARDAQVIAIYRALGYDEDLRWNNEVDFIWFAVILFWS